MSNIPFWQGRFVWTDLMSTDVNRSVEFFTKLFGWKTEVHNMGPEIGDYTVFLRGEDHVGGAMQLKKEFDVPSHFVPYVSVPDIDAAQERLTAAGGKTCHGPMDIPEIGRFSVITDPAGGVISPFEWLTPPESEDKLPKGRGSFCWWELCAENPESSEKFYTELFGWKTSTMEMGSGGTYYIFNAGEKGAGGMMQKPAEAAGTPQHWLGYVEVEDVDAAHRRVLELGGECYYEPTDIPGMGRFAAFTDPTGAAFAVYHETKQS